jgi:NAD+ diphosphatase
VATILVRADGRALFVRRAEEPAKGKLAMPGGFVDPGEGAETALLREVREETGLEARDLQYLGSHANRYPFGGVTYHTVDVFFVARTDAPEDAGARDEVADVLWLDPFTVPLEEFAFDSLKAALVQFRARHQRRCDGS